LREAGRADIGARSLHAILAGKPEGDPEAGSIQAVGFED
jgi:hypothetical protein